MKTTKEIIGNCAEVIRWIDHQAATLAEYKMDLEFGNIDEIVEVEKKIMELDSISLRLETVKRTMFEEYYKERRKD